MWILTGDKIETAINIAFACNLLKKKQKLVKITDFNADKIHRTIRRNLQSLKVKKKKFSVCVSGDSLITINKNDNLKEIFIKLIL